MFDTLRYLRDFDMPHQTSASNLSTGWIGITCPFCPNPHGPRGGISPEGYYNCWRCGWHPIEDLVMALENIPYHDACRRVREYDTDEVMPPRRVDIVRPQTVTWPPGTSRMQARHRDYLARRRFDPDWLEERYSLMGTGPVGDYANRIIAPVMVDGVMVSYQGRDITGRDDPKYRACPGDLEVIPHKHVLYNIDNAGDGPLVVVEGITDVWRLGDRAVATFGTKFTWPQVKMMARYRKVYILYDSEHTAQNQARDICLSLTSLTVQASVVHLPVGDPGDLSNEQARQYMEEMS